MADKIEKDKVVSLYYKVSELDGPLIDETAAGDPLQYLHGHNNLIVGLESLLTDVNVGEKLNATIPPEQAYGPYNPELVQDISKEAFFDQDIQLEEGMLFTAETENGVVPFYIKAINGDVITVDGNHALSGKTLVFDIEVLAVRDARAEEIAAGLPKNQ